MTKEVFKNFIDQAKAQGITKFAMRCEGGNRVAYHNEETGKIFLKDDCVISVALSRNYAVSGTTFVFTVIDYEFIDSVLLNEVPYTESIEIAKSLDIWDKELQEFFANTPNRIDLKPGTAGLAAVADEEGNPVLGKGTVGYVTN